MTNERCTEGRVSVSSTRAWDLNQRVVGAVMTVVTGALLVDSVYEQLTLVVDTPVAGRFVGSCRHGCTSALVAGLANNALLSTCLRIEAFTTVIWSDDASMWAEFTCCTNRA